MRSAEFKLTRVIESNAQGVKLAHSEIVFLDISGSDLRNASWDEANVGPLITHGADLRGAINLAQDQLKNAIGNERTLLPQGYHVWSCWKSPPSHFERYVENLPEFATMTRGGTVLHSKTSAKETLLCEEGTEPEKTGCPRALDDDRPCTD